MPNKQEAILIDLIRHFPDMRRYDVEQRLHSVSFALKLPLSNGATWGLTNDTFLAKYEGWWQATIQDRTAGYLTYKHDRSLAVAICKVWLAWKELQS
ncbi:hypothetical protein LCGC14_0620640 [marine sediment metagenome]|uniref:Uncharacterized protein n=1 Tax=marine sediment metagenome TaxID=412755 RepID=A0A0F9TRB5_9ZZZZ